MSQRFKVELLEEADQFLQTLTPKVQAKIVFNLRKVQVKNDPELFKKLNEDIWEFRTLYDGLQYRFLAFWDKRQPTETLVLATHGFVKKSQKTPPKEIEKAERIREEYFESS